MNKAKITLATLAVLFAGSLAAAGETAPNRLATAKPGEWASYRLPSGYIQKLTVTEREGTGPEAQVTVRVENIYDGDVVDVREITQDAGEPVTEPQITEDQGILMAVRRDTAAVKGRDVTATIVELSRDDGDGETTVVEWWTAAEIPVFGIIKKVEDGNTAWEVEDWGEK